MTWEYVFLKTDFWQMWFCDKNTSRSRRLNPSFRKIYLIGLHPEQNVSTPPRMSFSDTPFFRVSESATEWWREGGCWSILGDPQQQHSGKHPQLQRVLHGPGNRLCHKLDIPGFASHIKLILPLFLGWSRDGFGDEDGRSQSQSRSHSINAPLRRGGRDPALLQSVPAIGGCCCGHEWVSEGGSRGGHWFLGGRLSLGLGEGKVSCT